MISKIKASKFELKFQTMLSRSFNTFLCRSTSRASTSKCFSSSSSFEEIPVKNLPTLRDKYKVDWPAHIVAYTLIDNFIWWFKNIPKTKDFVKVYSLNGKLENDATFIAAVVRKIKKLEFST